MHGEFGRCGQSSVYQHHYSKRSRLDAFITACIECDPDIDQITEIEIGIIAGAINLYQGKRRVQCERGKGKNEEEYEE
jgi:hypothetical protein